MANGETQEAPQRPGHSVASWVHGKQAAYQQATLVVDGIEAVQDPLPLGLALTSFLCVCVPLVHQLSHGLVLVFVLLGRKGRPIQCVSGAVQCQAVDARKQLQRTE